MYKKTTRELNTAITAREKSISLCGFTIHMNICNYMRRVRYETSPCQHNEKLFAMEHLQFSMCKQWHIATKWTGAQDVLIRHCI